VSTPNKYDPPINQPPNALAKYDIEINDYQRADGNWYPMLKIKAAMDFVEFAVVFSPDAARAIAKTLTAHADACEKKLVVPKALIS